ncbi:MAG TPA: hypothetical protein PLK90_01775 [Clostridiales bacterium]|nr:hypothetical protein [Clostridiales bacterium]HQP69104.1 hypothetical protein [Clostridiales bacterium]
MKKIVTYLIILGIMQLYARSFDYRNNSEKSIPDSTAFEKNTRSSYIPYEENRVHRAGIFWLNVSNTGWFGDPLSSALDPCTGKTAPSGELPGGSGIDYLYLAALWFGGYIDSTTVTVDNVPSAIFKGPLVSTATDGTPSYSGEIQPYYFDDDPSGINMGRIKETSNIEGKLSCLFEEVYDPKATAYEQFTVRFTDKGTDQYTFNSYDNRGHIPLGIEVKQVSYAWPYDYAKKFIIVDYTIYNRNKDKKDIYDFFMGLYVDSDVKNTNVHPYGHLDDLCGFIEKWNGYIDPATGENKSVDMNLIWSADNDGREYIADETGWFLVSEPESGSPIDGAAGIFSIRVLRNPNPSLKYSFNLYNSGWTSESLDWGPRWQTGMHSDWQYDLTVKQKGYDDTNYDSLFWYSNEPAYGGRTEGTPLGDTGTYMIMSNDEFDHNQTSIREVYLGMDTQTNGSPIPQADKWQRYTTPETLGQQGFSSDIIDGSVSDINDIANGTDERFVLSFGPLGSESYINLAVDTNGDSLGLPDDYINKKLWKFAYGDSLKLTLAYIVSENFHTSLEQNPNYNDTTVVDLSEGINVSLYDQGWYDAFYNVVWAERVYDTPMFDTPAKRWGATKKDGWFGEDVGADAMFGDLVSDTYCWWMDKAYPGPDEGEGDFEITSFTAPVTDCYGNTASGEDKLLPFGRQLAEDNYGQTGNSENGEGYGYMVKYDKLGGDPPQGAWVRYGYDNGRLDAGDGVPDFTSPPPPPSPKIKVTELDNEIIVEWTSHEFYAGDDGSVGVAGPEFTYDPYTRLYDFEGYNIEISPDRQLNNFTTIFSVDKMNYSYQNVADVKDYLDNPVPADTLAAHPEDYPAMRTVNGKIYSLVPYGDNRDLTQTFEKEGLFRYSCITAASAYPKWGSIRYYKFVLYDQTLAEKKYIAVTAKDFGAPKMGVPAIKSSPESNATATVTATLSNTDEVIVVPNPYRGDVKYTDMGWEDLDGSYTYAEEYRKIAFLNIPERSVIRIYTLAGDLCKVITHNGNSDPDVPYWYGRNGAYWNLINDNRQACLSGLYLFSVQDADKKKDDFVGKFVVIK